LEHLTQSATVAALHHLLHHSALHSLTLSMHSIVIVGPLLAYRLWSLDQCSPSVLGCLLMALRIF
jgi:hypothetical protein